MHTCPHAHLYTASLATVINIQNKTHTSGGSRDDLKGDVIGEGEGGFFYKGGGGDFSPFVTMREECSQAPF